MYRSECAFGSDNEGKAICSKPEVLQTIKAAIGVRSFAEAKEKTNCPTESCLYKIPVVKEALSRSFPRLTLNATFKPRGPWKTPQPLDDTNLFEEMKQWERKFPEFSSIEYQLLDFMDDHESQLMNLDWKRLVTQQGKRYFAVIINTTTRAEAEIAIQNGQTPGKHWFALFVNLKGVCIENKSTTRRTPACTIEFFNSSGKPPRPCILQYMKQLENKLTRLFSGINLFVVSASQDRHQHSNTECGVYSLFYIYQRLSGVPYTWFLENIVSDEKMMKFRQFLFRSF